MFLYISLSLSLSNKLLLKVTIWPYDLSFPFAPKEIHFFLFKAIILHPYHRETINEKKNHPPHPSNTLTR